jgi:transketolase
MEAQQLLLNAGIKCSLLLVSTLHPIDRESFTSTFRRFKALVTVEAHYITGGLGSLAAEIIADAGLSAPLLRLGISSGAGRFTGSARFLSSGHGLSPEGIAKSVANSPHIPH